MYAMLFNTFEPRKLSRKLDATCVYRRQVEPTDEIKDTGSRYRPMMSNTWGPLGGLLRLSLGLVGASWGLLEARGWLLGGVCCARGRLSAFFG